jgi:beta-phosphoglucomutase-like phosphatase (HAD superfamily)
MYGLLFDLDGVLVDSKDLHYKALNMALADVNASYMISEQEQALTYEGLTTKAKLNILNVTKGLPKSKFAQVWNSKQLHTADLFSSLEVDAELADIFSYAKSSGALVGVVSNSIRQTLDVCLTHLGIFKYVDISISNEDVHEPKPNPEPYLLAIKNLGLDPASCAIFEDSDIGKRAALASGGLLIPIVNRKDLTLEKVQLACQTLLSKSQ